MLHGGQTLKYDVSLRNLPRFFDAQEPPEEFSISNDKVYLDAIRDDEDAIPASEIMLVECNPDGNESDDEMDYFDMLDPF